MDREGGWFGFGLPPWPRNWGDGHWIPRNCCIVNEQVCVFADKQRSWQILEIRQLLPVARELQITSWGFPGDHNGKWTRINWTLPSITRWFIYTPWVSDCFLSVTCLCLWLHRRTFNTIPLLVQTRGQHLVTHSYPLQQGLLTHLYVICILLFDLHKYN